MIFQLFMRLQQHVRLIKAGRGRMITSITPVLWIAEDKEEIGMKVMLINGSPHERGCTSTALTECAKTLKEGGIETEFFWIGKKPVQGCVACGGCARLGRCAFNDIVNEFIEKAQTADGFIFGSPVYFSGMNGSLMSFMRCTSCSCRI